ncbi:MAG: DUF2306 domain-containing protein [Caulobacter sp.]|nr:DUF2306 domain-containing protein [Caulobacter sp.]
MIRAIDRTTQITFLLLALAVGLFSLRYLAPEPLLGAPNVLANRFADMALAIHAGLGATALILGPWQFFRWRDGRRGAGHRVVGVIYVAACLLSAPAGLLLAFGATAGPIAGAGFGLLALAWFGTTAMGLRAVLLGEYQAHRRWMIRSFALTFAAVTLRLYLFGGPLVGFAGLDAYRAIAFLCWVPNLLAAELLLRTRPSFRLPAAAGR